MEQQLIKQILSMMVLIICGVVLVKSGKVRSEDSEILSAATIYLILPCVVIESFQIEITDSVRKGFFAAVAAAVLIHGILYTLCRIFRRIWHLASIEEASIYYSNAGNMIIPLVAAVLGKEMLIYASAFLCVQTILMWTHGVTLVGGKSASGWKNIIKNPNLIAVVIGLIMFATGLRLPEIISIPMDALASMIGPISMLTIGMIISRVSVKQMAGNKRLYLISILKMLVVPIIVLGFLKVFQGMIHLESGKEIFLVSFMAVIAPTATSIMQMANVYRKDAVYAGMINAMTTIACMVTMPVMVILYQHLV